MNAAGTPLPPSAVTDRLQRLFGDAITLRWGGAHERCWQVWHRWPPHHRGWARVRAQEIPPEGAFDIIGRLPSDCSVDQAPALLEHALRTWPDDEVQRMAGALRDWNADIAARQIDAATEAVLSRPDPTAAPPRRLHRKKLA